MFTNGEIEYLKQELEKLLNDEMKEMERISFMEPDIVFTLYPKVDIRTLENVIYVREGCEIQDIYIEFEINVIDEKHMYNQQSYKITLVRNQIIKLYNYLKELK